MKNSIYAVSLLCIISFLSAVPARSQAGQSGTIGPETTARLVLQSNLSSKLNEPGDPITASLDEPLYVNGEIVLPRGTEFLGKVTEATPAGRGQKNGKIGIIFDRIRLPWGEVPAVVEITAIDDWTSNEKKKPDEEGQVKGSRSGKRTADNVGRGATIGGAGGLATVLLGGGRALGGAAIGGGLLGGLLLTRGGDVRLAPGAIFRIKFTSPITLPVTQQPGSSPRPGQPSAPDSQDPTKKP
ncbi:MAG TPA: hypothetical protein VKC34_06980 [Blastocatellia bacterium]|nr:hypothetical protein [Blastocatellia bacterium]